MLLLKLYFSKTDQIIQSGTLSKTVNFQRAGTITTVYNAYLSDAKLSLTIDNNENTLPGLAQSLKD